MKKRNKWFFGLLTGAAAFLVPIQAFAEEETMKQKLGFAAQNTVVGIVTVFCILLLIALVIYLLRFLPKLINLFKRKEKEEGGAKQENVSADEQTPPPVDEQTPPPLDEPAGAPLQADYTELIAVIAAAIAADEQVPVGSFVVRTIKKRA